MIEEVQNKIYVDIGQTYQSKHGEYEVIMISDARCLFVEFKNTGSIVKTTVYRIRQGSVTDPAMKRKRNVKSE